MSSSHLQPLFDLRSETQGQHALQYCTPGPSARRIKARRLRNMGVARSTCPRSPEYWLGIVDHAASLLLPDRERALLSDKTAWLP